MRMFDVQGIEITAPRRKVFEFLCEPANLPRWAHTFMSAGNGRARLETSAGAVDVGLGVTADADTGVVRRLARDIARVHPAFPVRAFTSDACRGLDALELLDRGRHIAVALGAHLPPSYPEAIGALLRSLGPEHAADELIGVGMAPFFYLPHTLFVAERGLKYFDLSMGAQYELTKRFSAEGSIRAYISRDPERAWTFCREGRG